MGLMLAMPESPPRILPRSLGACNHELTGFSGGASYDAGTENQPFGHCLECMLYFSQLPIAVPRALGSVAGQGNKVFGVFVPR